MTEPTGPASPRAKTIKRLFAVSGNRCAFTDCTTALIDDAGSVVGEMCHICAQNADGPRYDPLQTQEERHGFDNLILMCGPHHKRIDDDPIEFTVTRLQELKGKHEAGKPPTFVVPDAAVEAVLRKFAAANVRAGDNSIVAGRDITIVSAGMSYEDVRAIALDVYRANAITLAGVAQHTARERAEELTNAFLKKLQAEPPSAKAEESLSDPDMQHALFEAQKAAARSGSSDLSAVLADLLVDRAKSKEDIMKVVLNEAISVAAKLTRDQFDALSVIFILKYTRRLTVRDAATLRAFLDATVFRLLDTASRTMSRYQHLQYAGCLGTQTFAAGLGQVLGGSYPHVAEPVFDPEKLRKAIGVDEQGLDALLGHVFLRDGEVLKLLPRFDLEFEPGLERSGISAELRDKLKNYIVGQGQGAFEKLVSGLHPRIAELTAYWTKFGASFTLTSVGIAIAHSNLRRLGMGENNLSIWIN